MKLRKNTSNGSTACKLLDRNNCFATVAAAVKEVVSDSVVDLKFPEVKSPQNIFLTHPKFCLVVTDLFLLLF